MAAIGSRERQKNFRNCKILLIEDNPGQIEIMTTALHTSIPEADLLVANNAYEAATLLQEINDTNDFFPKLILLDLYLPDKEDGLEVLRIIKAKSSPFLLIPVIILSNSTNAQDVKDAYNIGCSAYTVKPMGFEPWLTYFENVRHHWLETVILPSVSN